MQCERCWKKLNKEELNRVGSKKRYYLICNKCLNIEYIQKLIKNNDWEVIQGVKK